MKDDSKLFSALALLLIIGAGVAVYFVYFNQPTPQPKPESGKQETPPPAKRPTVKARDFTQESAGRSDPVVSKKPELPVTLDKTLRRMLISGRVTDEGGRVLSDVRVEFQGTGDLAIFRGTGFTDPSGMYSLLAWERNNIRRVSGAPTGGWVYAKAPDGRLAAGEAQSFALGAMAAMPDVVLKMQAAIEGTVLGSDGAPAPFAQVTLRSMGRFRVLDETGGSASYENRPVVRSANADEKGRYSFTRLVPGSYGLSVEPGYFGAAPNSATVDANDGATHWQDLKLARQNCVRGTLKDQDGTPIEGAVVVLQKTGAAKLPEIRALEHTGDKSSVTPKSRKDAIRGGDFRANSADWRCITDAEGRFGFADLPDAQLELHAQLGNSAANLSDVHVNTGDYALTLTLECSVAGTVRDAATNQPINNYDIRIYGGDAEPSPFDSVTEDAVFPWHSAGRYRIFNAPQGTIALRVSAPGYAPTVLNVKDIAASERRIGVDFALKPLCDLTLILKSGEKLLPREPVFLLYDGRSLAESSTDDFGEVRLPALMAADYEIRVQRADGSVLSGKITVPAQHNHAASVLMAPK